MTNTKSNNIDSLDPKLSATHTSMPQQNWQVSSLPAVTPQTPHQINDPLMGTPWAVKLLYSTGFY